MNWVAGLRAKKYCLFLVLVSVSTPCFGHNCPSSVRKSSRQWLEGYPINHTSLELANGRIDNAVELWEDLIVDLASTSEFSETKNSIALRVSNPSRQISRFRMPSHLLESWKVLGLLDDQNQFNLELSFDDYLRILNARLQALGLRIKAYGPDPLWWKGNFLSGYEFATGILSGSFPVDDLHAVLFHGPDLIHSERSPVFLWALRWIQLESFIHSQTESKARRTPSHRMNAEARDVSFHYFHAYFEGRQSPDVLNPDLLPGFIRVIQPNIRGRIDKHSDEFWQMIIRKGVQDLDPFHVLNQIRIADFPAWGDTRRFWFLGAKIAQAQIRAWKSQTDFSLDHYYIRGERLSGVLDRFESDTAEIIKRFETSLESPSLQGPRDARAR